MAKSLNELDTSLPPEEPDAWERFETAVDKVMRGGPQHRPPAPKAEKTGEDH